MTTRCRIYVSHKVWGHWPIELLWSNQFYEMMILICDPCDRMKKQITLGLIHKFGSILVLNLNKTKIVIKSLKYKLKIFRILLQSSKLNQSFVLEMFTFSDKNNVKKMLQLCGCNLGHFRSTSFTVVTWQRDRLAAKTWLPQSAKVDFSHNGCIFHTSEQHCKTCAIPKNNFYSLNSFHWFLNMLLWCYAAHESVYTAMTVFCFLFSSIVILYFCMYIMTLSWFYGIPFYMCTNAFVEGQSKESKAKSVPTGNSFS